MHEWRNHLVHGAHDYANDMLWTWRKPTKAKGNAAFSFQFTLDSIQLTPQSWQNFAAAVHDELHQGLSATTGGGLTSWDRSRACIAEQAGWGGRSSEPVGRCEGQLCFMGSVRSASEPTPEGCHLSSTRSSSK